MMPAAQLPGRAPGTQWALAWEGTVRGDITGVIRWWIEFPPTLAGRWEIWDCEPVYPASNCQDPAQLIMAGYETFGYVTDVDWKGKGIVTYTNEEYAEWYGRRTNDGGYVDFVGGLPSYGEGWFTILDRPANKH